MPQRSNRVQFVIPPGTDEDDTEIARLMRDRLVDAQSRAFVRSTSSPATKPAQLVAIDAGFDEMMKKRLRLEVQEVFADEILNLQAERDRLAAARMVDADTEAAELKIYQERKRNLGKAMTKQYAERIKEVCRSQSMDMRTQAVGYRAAVRPRLTASVDDHDDLESAPGTQTRGNAQGQ
jgi:hypothetical protein